MTTVYRTPEGKDIRDWNPPTDLYVPPVATPAIPVNTIPLVVAPANGNQTVTRTIAWGAGWTGVTDGVSTFTIRVYFNGAFQYSANYTVANFPGGNVNATPDDLQPAAINGVGTYKWGIIVTNAIGPSVEYQTNDSIAT